MDQILGQVKTLLGQPFKRGRRAVDQPCAPCFDDHPSGAGELDPKAARLAPSGEIIQDHHCAIAKRKRRSERARLAGAEPGKLRRSRLRTKLPEPPRPESRHEFRPASLPGYRDLGADRTCHVYRSVKLAQPGQTADTCKPDQRARIGQNYFLARHAFRFLSSSRNVLASPRITGMPALPISCMNSSSAIPAIFAPRPREILLPL